MFLANIEAIGYMHFKIFTEYLSKQSDLSKPIDKYKNSKGGTQHELFGNLGQA